LADIHSFMEHVQSLVQKFDQDKNHYLQKGYPEAQVRIDFLNPFFDALGWDIENKAHKPPHERDVIVEVSPETTLRPDYNFRINGSTKFFVEAKAPWVPLDDVNHIMQVLIPTLFQPQFSDYSDLFTFVQPRFSDYSVFLSKRTGAEAP